MTDAKKNSRRRYGAELKQQILAQCAEPGASVASIAMAHGINANVVHKWRRLAMRRWRGRSGAGTVNAHGVGAAIPGGPVGGPPGYMDFLQAMRDPKHEQHADHWRWWGGPFDPHAFSINAANMAIRKLR